MELNQTTVLLAKSDDNFQVSEYNTATTPFPISINNFIRTILLLSTRKSKSHAVMALQDTSSGSYFSVCKFE